jgi:hypothetical protein
MERRQTGESGQAAGGSVQTLGAQLKRLVADAGLFIQARSAATSQQFTNFSCRPRAKNIRQPETLDNPETIR